MARPARPRRGGGARAARLFGAADAHGLPWWHFTQRLSVTTRDELRTRLGPLYATLEAEGGAMDRERLEELLAEVDP